MKALTTIFFLIICFSLKAEADVSYVPYYHKSGDAPRIMRIPMSFNSDSLLRGIPSISIGRIYQIDYVATAPKGAGMYYQKKLNAERWKKFKSAISIPEGSEHYENTIYQTRFNSKEEAEKLFHGFVLYFDSPLDAVHKASKSSFTKLMEQLAERTINDRTTTVKIPKSVQRDSVYVGVITEERKVRMEEILMTNNQLLDWNYDSIGVDKKFYGAYYFLTKVSAGVFAAYKALRSTHLFRQLNEANITDKTLVVTDMTGSMYPYFSQLLVWHALKMNEGKKLPYVFFNDGDNAKHKPIGHTGGLYPVETNSTFKLYGAMKRCMQGGYGGDCPENNMEAVLEGLDRYEGIDKVVLICDNWAYPRDANLINQIDVPIDFVMCGSDFGVKPAYLDLARCNAGGRVITIQKSISDMENMEEGDKMRIGKFQYVLRRGLFKQTKLN
jgi:hypothetical protein